MFKLTDKYHPKFCQAEMRLTEHAAPSAKVEEHKATEIAPVVRHEVNNVPTIIEKKKSN